MTHHGHAQANGNTGHVAINHETGTIRRNSSL